MFWIVPITLLIIFESVADYFAKTWSLKSHSQLWLLAISFYVVGNLFWLVALKHGSGLARGSVIFSVGSAILAVLLGLLCFKEQVSRVELVGLVLGIIAIGLLAFE